MTDNVHVVTGATPRTPGFVRLVVVSDTHNVDIPLELLPPGDILIHAGDHTVDGLPCELRGAASWLRSAAERYAFGAIVVAGNHDGPLDTETWLRAAPHRHPGEAWTPESMADAVHMFNESPLRLLQHSEIDVAGLRFFGSPYVSLTPRREAMDRDDPLRNEGFVRDDEQLAQQFSSIPAGLDVLITHCPPFGVLDSSVQYGGAQRDAPVSIGSVALSRRLMAMGRRKRPRVHVFGHEHDSRGALRDRSTLFVNAAAVDGDRGTVMYSLKNGFNPMVVDILPRSASR